MTEEGWQPLRKPDRARGASGAGAEGFRVTPFVRLARVHAAVAAADGGIAVALAGSVFFAISPTDARWRVAAYLFLTMAPFAVVTPLIGPAIDRVKGGRRMMIMATITGRVILAFLMISHIESLLLFPEAFLFLVLQKGYSVAKTAVVPGLVHSKDDLVNFNAKLALISAVSSTSGAVVAGTVSFIAGPAGACFVAMLGFIAALVFSFQMPSASVAPTPAAELEKVELRGARILVAASSMAVMRGVVGFVTFLLAFEFRGGEESLSVSKMGEAAAGASATVRGIDIVGNPPAPIWHFGVVLAAAASGALIAAKVAPPMRRRFTEESMLLGAFVGAAVTALFSALSGGLFGATLLSLGAAVAAGTGKLAFDAFVQREAPDANYGRTFSKFEARFQVAWVVGAFIPVVLPMGATLGSFIVMAAATFAAASFFVGGRNGGRRPKPGPVEDDDGVLTEEDLRPSQPSPPTGTNELASKLDATTVMPVDPTEPPPVDPTTALPADPTIRDDESVPRPSASPQTPRPPSEPKPDGPFDQGRDSAPVSVPWYLDQLSPTVTSVEGVEVDDGRPVPPGFLPPTEPRDER